MSDSQDNGPMVSVIIPFRVVDVYIRKCVEELLKQDYLDFEIILLPDSGINEKWERCRVIVTGKVKPSVKRNIGIENARGGVCAFIDSDAYPEKGWIKKGAGLAMQAGTGIVGGPNLVPPEDSVWQKAGDDVLTSFMGAGGFAARYKAKKTMECQELQSCNFFARTEILKKVKGFDTTLLTAEDAKLCFEISRLGKVIYSPELIVYHHRRPLFRKHLKQMWVYGRDKGMIISSYLSKKKLQYFIPSLFVLYLVIGFVIVSVLHETILWRLYFGLLGLYVIAVIVSALLRSVKRSPLSVPGIILTHIFYGTGFLYGMLKRK